MKVFLTSAPGLPQRWWGNPVAIRLGYREQASAPGPQAKDEPHPTLMQTLAAQPRQVGRLCRGQCPGRSRYSFVPGSVAIRKCVGLTLQGECPVRPGSRSGRIVRRFLLVFQAALRWGSGGTWEGASAPSPFYLGQLRADPVPFPRPIPAASPRHTPRIGKVTGTAGVPSKRRAAGAAAQDPRIGLIVH